MKTQVVSPVTPNESVRDSVRSALRVAFSKDGLGSQAAVADALGCSQQTLSYAFRQGVLQLELARPLETALNGLVTVAELRPLDWHVHWPERIAELSERAGMNMANVWACEAMGAAANEPHTAAKGAAA